MANPTPTNSGKVKTAPRRLSGERTSAMAARTGKQAAISVLVSTSRHPTNGQDKNSIAATQPAHEENPRERQIINIDSAAPIENISDVYAPPSQPHPKKVIGKSVAAPP